MMCLLSLFLCYLGMMVSGRPRPGVHGRCLVGRRSKPEKVAYEKTDIRDEIRIGR